MSVLAALLVLALRAGMAQSISLVSGNGQLLRTDIFNHTIEPMVVQVKDAAGNPLPNWPVTWTVTSGSSFGQTVDCDTKTSAAVVDSSNKVIDPGGKATCRFAAFSQAFTNTFVQSVVTASALSSSQAGAPPAPNPVPFAVTILNTTNNAPSGQPELIFPIDSTMVFSGQAGTQAAGTSAIQVRMFAGGLPVPNVGVHLVVQPDPNTGKLPGSTIACAGTAGIALTNDSGYASCTPVFGGTVGSGRFSIAVGGGYVYYPNWLFRVQVGPPAVIRMTAGDNQPSAPPNTNLTSTLAAQVEDAAGNVLPNVPVEWQVTPPGAATLLNASTASDGNGRVSARVHVNSIPGPGTITVKTKTGTASYTFKFSVNLVFSSFEKAGGDSQDAPVNTVFPQPLSVRVTGPNGPISNVTVHFEISGTGDAVVLTPDAATNEQGVAQTQVKAGTQLGQVTVAAKLSNQTLTFILNQRPPGPTVSADNFYAEPFFAAGSPSKGKIAVGGVVTIVAPGVAAGLSGYVVPTAPYGPLPYVLAGVSVKFGNIPAPIYHVGNWNGKEFVTVQVPLDVTPGQVPVTVSIRGSGENTATVPVLATAPAIFETVMSDGKLRAVAVRENGTYVSLENRAQRGEVVRLYISGLGQTSPAAPTNQPGTDQDALQIPIVGISGEGVWVLSARYAQNLIGVYEVQVQISDTAPLGSDITVNVLTFNGDQRADSNTSRIPIQ